MIAYNGEEKFSQGGIAIGASTGMNSQWMKPLLSSNAASVSTVSAA